MNTNGFQEMITSDGQVSANGTLYAAKKQFIWLSKSRQQYEAMTN